jgi:hypothetical protein
LISFDSIEKRYDYLKLSGSVGEQTFGVDRYLNQKFYKSTEWKRIRDIVLIRDNGCDLGVLDFPILGRILIHHMNPIKVIDLRVKNLDVLDPNFLISSSERTHQAIHYGDNSLLPYIPKQRKPGDTRLW